MTTTVKGSYCIIHLFEHQPQRFQGNVQNFLSVWNVICFQLTAVGHRGGLGIHALPHVKVVPGRGTVYVHHHHLSTEALTVLECPLLTRPVTSRDAQVSDLSTWDGFKDEYRWLRLFGNLFFIQICIWEVCGVTHMYADQGKPFTILNMYMIYLYHYSIIIIFPCIEWLLSACMPWYKKNCFE